MEERVEESTVTLNEVALEVVGIELSDAGRDIGSTVAVFSFVED